MIKKFFEWIDDNYKTLNTFFYGIVVGILIAELFIY
jgi:hypothetical protein